jgi:hypothetical protein
MSTHEDDVKLAGKIANESEDQCEALKRECAKLKNAALDAERLTNKSLTVFQERTSFQYRNPDTIKSDLQLDLEIHQNCIETFTPEVEERVAALSEQIKELHEKLDPLLAHKRQANNARWAVQTTQESIDFLNSPNGVTLSDKIKERKTAEKTAKSAYETAKANHEEFMYTSGRVLIEFLKAKKNKSDADFQGSESVRPRNLSGRSDSTRDYFPNTDTEEEFRVQAKKKHAYEEYTLTAEVLAKKYSML